MMERKPHKPCTKRQYSCAMAKDKVKFYKSRGRTTRIKGCYYCRHCGYYHLTSKKKRKKGGL